ncbi:hypothetical protein ColTof3_10963 [Colletotrichum tofieldiae]|nr:hypothetical protein ColTof3_10963 [Colletotrichum tofieldiae]
MGNAALVEVSETLEQLQRVNHDDLFVLDAAVLQQVRQRPALTELHEDVDSVAVDFDTIVGDDVGVVENLQDTHFVLDLLGNGGDQLRVLQTDLLDGHQVTRVQVHGGVNVAKGTAANEVALLPAHRDVGSRGREVGQGPVDLVVSFEHATQRLPLGLLGPPDLVDLLELLQTLLGDILGGFVVVKHPIFIETLELANQGLNALLLRLRRQVGSCPHDVKVRDEKSHAAGYLGPKPSILLLAQGQDVSSSGHSHGKLQSQDRPTERLSIRCDTVVADEANPVQCELGELEVVHLFPVTVHDKQRALAELCREDETGLDKLLHLSALGLLADNLDTVDIPFPDRKLDHVTEPVRVALGPQDQEIRVAGVLCELLGRAETQDGVDRVLLRRERNAEVGCVLVVFAQHLGETLQHSLSHSDRVQTLLVSLAHLGGALSRLHLQFLLKGNAETVDGLECQRTELLSNLDVSAQEVAANLVGKVPFREQKFGLLEGVFVAAQLPVEHLEIILESVQHNLVKGLVNAGRKLPAGFRLCDGKAFQLDADSQLQEQLELADHLVLHHGVLLCRLLDFLSVSEPDFDDLFDQSRRETDERQKLLDVWWKMSFLERGKVADKRLLGFVDDGRDAG